MDTLDFLPIVFARYHRPGGRQGRLAMAHLAYRSVQRPRCRSGPGLQSVNVRSGGRGRRIADVESFGDPDQARRLLHQRMAGGGALFDHDSVLLRHLIHLVDRGIDLGQPGCLLVSGRGDRGTALVTSPTWERIRLKA